MSEQEMTIGFIGNPNCGKTTLFNAYTGANLKVANWPGVTVEKVEGVMKDHDLTIHLVDLPGTYSLTSYTMEETVSRQFILSDEVDVIINVADASALERSLYLTLQLLELGKRLVPFFAPIGLGFWQIAVALIAGISAKEVVVSSCAVLFGIVNASSPEGMTAFASALSGIGFGPFNAFCLMVFCLLNIPCTATLGTIRKESNSWAWMGFTAFFQLAMAWLVTFFGVYQLGTLLMT